MVISCEKFCHRGNNSHGVCFCRLVYYNVCHYSSVFVAMAKLRENGYQYCHETFGIDGQWLWNRFTLTLHKLLTLLGFVHTYNCVYS